MVAHAAPGSPVGGRLHYRTFGSGPPLVILHGFLGASGNWQTLASGPFAEHFSTYTIDQRDHGRSPHTDRIDYHVLTEDLGAFLDARGLDQAHILGHSMGGKVAMQFALQHPQRVDRLVVVDITRRAYPPEHRPLLDALQQVDLDAASSRKDVDEALSQSIRSTPVRQFLLKNLGLDSDTRRYHWEINLDLLAREYDQLTAAFDAEGHFEGPALFVRGERSEYVRPEDEASLRALFPSARIETVAGAGHWVHADAPEAFARLVADFLLAGN